ncbi:MAG: class I SAM-dependent methyltransferase [Solirubrobacterales bacterium]
MTVPTREEAIALADRVPGSRLSARIYDPILWLGERSGLARSRQLLLSGARGDVIEVGAGTGLNLPRYPTEARERLVLVEPELHKSLTLAERAGGIPVETEVIRATAEALPLEADSFDTAVVTLCLCTVPEPEAALAEIARVLKPGGNLLFMEHVRSERPRLGRLQDRLRRSWAALADGCQCNRRTVETIELAGFEVEVDHGADGALMPPVARPIVSGKARVAQ